MLMYFRKHQRDRLVFNEHLMGIIGRHLEAIAEEPADQRREALHKCLHQLECEPARLDGNALLERTKHKRNRRTRSANRWPPSKAACIAFAKFWRSAFEFEPQEPFNEQSRSILSIGSKITWMVSSTRRGRTSCWHGPQESDANAKNLAEWFSAEVNLFEASRVADMCAMFEGVPFDVRADRLEPQSALVPRKAFQTIQSSANSVFVPVYSHLGALALIDRGAFWPSMFTRKVQYPMTVPANATKRWRDPFLRCPFSNNY